jgi:hypothetical protein
MRHHTFDAPRIRLVHFEARVQDLRTRLPFRYGNACLLSAPSLLVRLTVEDERGRTARGLAGDALPPRWFDKDPAKAFREDVAAQLRAVEIARDVYLESGREPQTAAEHWNASLPRVHEIAAREDINALTASFGSSFLERAMLDALCRLRGVSFYTALTKRFTGLDAAAALPPAPLTRIGCRQTVGLADRITAGDIPPGERVDDGLPQALEESIARYGLYLFKVKVCGEREPDRERLLRIARLLAERCRRPFAVTLDGNEQYHSPDRLFELVELLDELEKTPAGRPFVERILFIEQPLTRETALAPEAEAGIRKLSSRKPVIIDESDEGLDSFRRALDLGYQGVSHKNCKGIFKSLFIRGCIAHRDREGTAVVDRFFQSAEDLVNLPVVPLQEDLAAVAALGIPHVERNGHHYFRGLDHLPPREAEAALRAHPDLYERAGESIRLRIRDGDIECGSLQCTGFGYASEIAFEERTELEAWELPE